MKKLFIFLLIFLFTPTVGAQSIIQKVEIAPLQGGISFNTVCLGSSDYSYGYKCWVTAPTVCMVGRKSLAIMNTSTSANVLLSNISGDTVHAWTLYPRETITFGAASSLNIYASASTVVTINTCEIR